MPAIFPALQPDELFFSTVARYADMMKFPSRRLFQEHLYGAKGVTPSVESARRLDDVMKRILPGRAFAGDTIIERHTLFPYYAHGMSPSQRRRVKESMRSSSGRSKFASTVKVQEPKLPTSLRYCKTCVEEDRRSAAGAAYWHRVHQLSGVLVCPHHDTTLTESDFRFSDRGSFQDYLSLESALSSKRVEDVEIEVPRRYAIRLREIARDSLWLLQNAPVDESNERSFPSRFKAWCTSQGWSNGTIFRINALSRALRSHYGTELLTLIGGGDSFLASKARYWIRQAKRRGSSAQTGSQAPIRYILAWRFLGLSAREFFRGEISRPPVRKERSLSGPCGNPVCPKHDPPVPRPISGKVPDGQKYVTVSCEECGFTYVQRPETADALKRRIKKTGPLWDAELRRLLRGGERTGKISAAMGVGPETIQRNAFRLGEWRESWGDRAYATMQRRSNYGKRVRNRHRKTWLDLRARFPEAGRTELKRKAVSTYQYLIRKDREWYSQHAPAPRKHGPKGASPAEWKARDDQVRNVV